jgi:signal transduction histidine kinase
LSQHRRLYLTSAAVVLLSAPVDFLVAGAVLPYSMLVRCFWAGLLIAGGEASRSGTPGRRRLLGLLTGAASPMFQALLAAWCGPVGNPTYGWLVAIPLVGVLLGQDAVWAAYVTGAAAVGSVVAATALSGAPARTVVAWGWLVFAAAFGGVLAARFFAQRRQTERALAAARRETEGLLRESETRREQAERLAMIGRLAAGMAHEINNPLTYISANLDFLRGELNQPGGARGGVDELLEETMAGVDRIGRIISDLRVFAREDPSGTPDCSPAWVVEEAARMTAARLRGQAELALELPPDLPQVRVGHQQLLHALVNLLLNALDAIASRGRRPGHISVKAARRDAGVEVVVEDDGPGLSPEALARLFEPFFTTKGPQQGTGLGLAITREHVRLRGGHIHASNRPTGGARFVLWLPSAAK